MPRNKSKAELEEIKPKPKTYIVHAVRYVREETSILVTANDDQEAEEIGNEDIFNDECTWEPDFDYYAKHESISVEEYGE